MPLEYHRKPLPGKYSTIPTKDLNNHDDLAKAYSPGVAEPCLEIQKDPRAAQYFTNKQHYVVIISNGTAVLGLGDIGALASKPVMEGKAVLIQKYVGLTATDLEINETDPKRLIEIIASLEPTFGGINLEDIKAPECFEIENELQNRLSIPVFHDDQHGTAIVIAAALRSALHIAKKDISRARCVMLGAGAGALATLNLLVQLGLQKDHILLCDRDGIVYQGRERVSEEKEPYARQTSLRTLEDAMQDADIFIGLSSGHTRCATLVDKMAPQPIVFPLANPIPEIDLAQIRRDDAITGSGRSDFPNQVNNVLCFPYLFKGALDVGARCINDTMKKACVDALSTIVRQGFSDISGVYDGINQEFGKEYFIARPFDPRLMVEISYAVAQAAIASKVASVKDFSPERYKKALIAQAYRDWCAFRILLLRSRENDFKKQPIYFEDYSSKALSIAQALVRYDVARPIFVGSEEKIRPILNKHPILALCARESSKPSLRCAYICSESLNTAHEIAGYQMPNKNSMDFITTLPREKWSLGLQSLCQMLQGEVFHDFPAPAFNYGSDGTVHLHYGALGALSPCIGPFRIEDEDYGQNIAPNDSISTILEKAAFSLLLADLYGMR